MNPELIRILKSLPLTIIVVYITYRVLRTTIDDYRKEKQDAKKNI